VPLRIDQPVDPQSRRHRKTHRHLLARGGRDLVLGRLAMQMRAIGVGDDEAGVLRKDLARQVLREGEEQPVAMGAVFVPFLICAQILDDDLISTIQISPRSFSATRSARRPDGSGSSLMQENPSERSSRAVPRAIASAVSDWRRSGGGTRAMLRALLSMG
jgi:hypothetical protein